MVISSNVSSICTGILESDLELGDVDADTDADADDADADAQVETSTRFFLFSLVSHAVIISFLMLSIDCSDCTT